MQENIDAIPSQSMCFPAIIAPWKLVLSHDSVAPQTLDQKKTQACFRKKEGFMLTLRANHNASLSRWILVGL